MPPTLQFILVAGAGLCIGAVIGWLIGRSRSSTSDSRLEEELRQQLGKKETEVGQLRSELASTRTAQVTADAQRDAVEKLLAEQRAVHEKALAEAKDAQQKALADLRDSFKALSAEALKQSHPEFIRLANETFARFQESSKGDLEKRQESIKGVVEPLRQQLDAYQKRLQQAESTQSSALGEVKKHLEMLAQHSQSLAAETHQFRLVLRSNQARGRWGEETLRRVVEAAGMSAHCDFSEQTRSGDAQPDLIVHLPGDRVIVVDSKVPDLDFLAAMETSEETKRSDLLAAHARRLRDTIKALADRDYPGQFSNALDHVVLFLPAESLFSAALEGDRDLIIWAAQKRIMLATPASLIALLRSVSVSWQQQAQTENARAIADAAGELFVRVCKFTEHLERIRAGLERANNSFNEAVGSYERMVQPAGRRLQELGGATQAKSLADLQPVQSTLRVPENARAIPDSQSNNEDDVA